MKTEQLDLFPRAIHKDFIKTKHLLSKYKWFQKMNSILLESKVKLTDKEKVIFDECQNHIRILDRAVKLIIDSETREVIEYRYIEGHSHKITVLHFSSKMDDRTVDRKIQKGIECIADTLLLCE